MSIEIDETALLAELSQLLRDDGFERGLSVLTSDPFFLAFFLSSASQGEGLGEAAVAMIGQEELAARIRDLRRQEQEERGHKEQTLDAARELFPDFFEGATYRYGDALEGRAYYVAVLEANRERLEQLGRYTRLNLYLTTTFAYEVMVMLLYRAVAESVAGSRLPKAVRGRIGVVLDGILSEEATHLGVIEQHNALLTSPRGDLSDEAQSLLEALARLTPDDYRAPAEHAVRQVVSMMQRYTEADRRRAEIQARAGA